jgi:hypothetical protein
MRVRGARGAQRLGRAAGVLAVAALVLQAAPAMGDVIGTPDGDSIRGGPGPNWIEGRAGNDRIWGQGRDDFIFGDAGNDRLAGGPVGDFLNGGEGNDRLHFGSGWDYGLGMVGNDQLRGGPGNDRPLQGGPGRDRIWGGLGNDELRGQQDRDLIWPGHGTDRAHGGSDRDRFLLRVDGTSDQVNCGTGGDVVMYNGQQDAADILTGCDRVWTDVTTPACVTGNEWDRVRPTMRKARAHRILETGGELAIRRTPTEFGRMYLQCRPQGPHWECFADLDFRVDSAGVPRLAGKAWGSICWTV